MNPTMTCDLVNGGLAVMNGGLAVVNGVLAVTNGVLAVNERTVLPCSGLAQLTTVRKTVEVVLHSCGPQPGLSCILVDHKPPVPVLLQCCRTNSPRNTKDLSSSPVHLDPPVRVVL